MIVNSADIRKSLEVLNNNFLKNKIKNFIFYSYAFFNTYTLIVNSYFCRY